MDRDEKYNLRPVIESVNRAIKTVIGEPLLSKNEEAQSCEVLAKILVYNLRRIVYWSARLGSRAERGIPPEQPQDPVRLPLESLYSRPEGRPQNNSGGFGINYDEETIIFQQQSSAQGL